MLDAEEVRTFVQGTVHFFETATGHPATVGSPYLCIDKSAVVQDYAGVGQCAPGFRPQLRDQHADHLRPQQCRYGRRHHGPLVRHSDQLAQLRRERRRLPSVVSL